MAGEKRKNIDDFMQLSEVKSSYDRFWSSDEAIPRAGFL
jgi:hypothetical protein